MDLTNNKVILSKAITWKILSSITTFIIAYFVLNDMKIAGEIMVIEFVVKTFIYYFHEKGWIKLSDYMKSRK